ncbi:MULTISPECIES: putative 2-aminoethylphosphonate ABC transporter substrate-binding protein [unclassified Leisingera]|uniref:putative 2-aminoethylphosphonate ABC transporter substrate-binding protein n=1 Tax=unclassified Leisingera TaxID=2614906 RepID=UPI000316AAD3|nr:MULTISPECIES: putative 2-aminoethylphosphonate ABC transporter substrate-binding protein [unclassified Leisingera]KIC23019.1 phosphonate ABC transporter substrate-binding protein [Leisingera sp. ANG-S3]KIC25870.1 phosphonate ABC transporter substrate-binding protein [Leisingera sp. ANG-M6]KIC30498.1 phosphonate ABC transporter substrate-binding protein [Leisingera sp. ANG-S5]KIC52399.1 phosphonate ABC transporter substrate-binding protein [Leisingera sp. ANG-S]KID07417.1 phosphonate ABC tra
MKQKASFITAFAFTIAAASASIAETELTVYTAVEAEDLARYAETFNQSHPDIKINWVRDSTGIITAKLLAERDNPQADVVWGLAATSLLLLKSEGMLEAYAPTGVDQLDSKFVDGDNPPSWVGMDAWVASVCYNTVEAEKLGLTPPSSWKDLTDPQYAGHVIMPNPNSSGTGFLDVSSWLQMFGEEEGWKFMDALHENIARYTHSGSKPCKLAAAGEIPIGISFAFRGAKSKAAGAPLEIIVPSEGVGWDMEATAIVAGTANLEAAQTLVDFTVTKEANEMYNTGYAVVAYPGVAKPVEHFPEGLLDAMIDNDFEFAANNRAAILKEWQARYDGKSEAK